MPTDGPPPGQSPIPPVARRRTGVAQLSLPRLVLLVVIVVLAFVVASLFVVLGMRSVAGDQGSAKLVGGFLLAMAVQPLVFVGGCYLLAIRRWHLDWRDFGLGAVSPRWLLLVPLVWLGAMPVMAGLKYLGDSLVGMDSVNPYAATFEAIGTPSIGLAVAIILLGGVVVPFSEEFVFRGLIYPWLRSRIGIAAAAGISAGLFALLHLHATLILPIFFLGLVLAWLRERSESLWPAVAFHGLHNSATFVIVFALMSAGIDPSGV